MSSVLSFIRKHGTATRTTLAVGDGASIRLSGMPAVYSVEGVAKLASAQLSDIKGSVRTTLEDGRKVSSAFSLSPDKGAQLVRGPEQEKGKKVRAGLPTADAVAPETNGVAAS